MARRGHSVAADGAHDCNTSSSELALMEGVALQPQVRDSRPFFTERVFAALRPVVLRSGSAF